MLMAPAARAQTNGPLGLNNIIQSVAVVNGGLVATTVTGQEIPITTTAARAPAGMRRDVGILHLALGPINLNLLGLQVDTSPICLNVTAQRGGGLLGDLLASIANLLNRRLSLAQILGGLSQTQLTQLLTGLRDLLNGALNTLNQAAVQSVTPAPPGGCPILNLVLGPLDLNLLGLNVHLDNCANGPITVTVTAIHGGGLLGDLLCDLLGGIPTGATLQGILQQVLQAILNALPTA